MPLIKKALKALNKKLFLFNAFCFFHLLLNAQFSFDKNCLSAYQKILSLEFSEATKFLAAEKSLHPGNPVIIYLNNYLDFFQVFITEEKPLYENYLKDFDHRLDQFEKADKNSPFFNCLGGNMHLQTALLKTKFGSYKSGALEFNQAYKLFNENAEKFPDFLPHQAGLGLVHVMAGVVPESFLWLVKIAGIEGDVQLGMKEISNIAEYAGNDDLMKILRLEALFYLSFIDVNLNPDSRNALTILQNFEKTKPDFPAPDNPLWIYTKVTILLKAHKNEEVLKNLNLYHSSNHNFRFCLLDYLTGLAGLYKLDPSADRYFIRFLKDFRGRNYIKSAYQKLGWFHLLNGNSQKYREYISLAQRRGVATSETDKQALKEAESKEEPNPILLKARLLFDGGYYDKALTILLDNSIMEFVRSKKDLIEYSYRLGRIFQESGDVMKALSYYDRTIKEGRSCPYYFSANAALQSGLIYEKKYEFRKAEKYFRICLDLDYDEYKTSLDQKAKAGLKRVKKQLD